MITKTLLLFLILTFSLSSFSQPESTLAPSPIESSVIQSIRNDIADKKYSDITKFTELAHKVVVTRGKDKTKTRMTRVFYYPTVEDIQQYGSDSIRFNAANQTVTVLTAASISAKGDAINLEYDDLKTIDSDSYNVFSSYKDMLIQYNGLEPGGYTILEYIVVQDNNLDESDWFTRHNPQVFLPRADYLFELEWQPNYRPSLVNTSEYINCTESNRKIICKGQDIPPAPNDDSFFWQDELGYIETSEFKDWPQLVKSYREIFYSALSNEDSDVQKYISENIDVTKDIKEQIQTAHHFVSRKIRYLSRSEHGHSITPHKTTETLNKRLGDCKDKTALLIDIFKKIGVEAYPVLVSTRKEKLDENRLPSLSQFNHVIACFSLYGNKYCIDPTDNYTPWDLIPSDIQGNYALPIIDGGNPYLLDSTESIWNLNVKTHITFNEKGGQFEAQAREYFDHAAASYRSYLAPYTEEERIDVLTDIYKEYVASEASTLITHSAVSEVGHTFSIESKTEFEPFLDAEKDLIYQENDAWIIKSLNEYLISNKHYGINLNGAKIETTYQFDVSKLWIPSILTADLQLESEYGSLTRKTSLNNDDTVTVVTYLMIPKQKIEPAEFTKFNSFIKNLKSQTAIQLKGKLKG